MTEHCKMNMTELKKVFKLHNDGEISLAPICLNCQKTLDLCSVVSHCQSFEHKKIFMQNEEIERLTRDVKELKGKLE